MSVLKSPMTSYAGQYQSIFAYTDRPKSNRKLSMKFSYFPNSLTKSFLRCFVDNEENMSTVSKRKEQSRLAQEIRLSNQSILQIDVHADVRRIP